MDYTVGKAPGEVLEYTINWAAELGDSEVINTSAFTAPAGITIDSDTKTTTAATVWLSGGTAGVEYEITNTIVSSQGRTHEKTIAVPVLTQ